MKTKECQRLAAAWQREQGSGVLSMGPPPSAGRGGRTDRATQQGKGGEKEVKGRKASWLVI